jgi:RPA family protein
MSKNVQKVHVTESSTANGQHVNPDLSKTTVPTLEHLSNVAAYRNQLRQEYAALLQQHKNTLVEVVGKMTIYERDLAELQTRKTRLEGSINLLEQLLKNI